MNMSRIYITSRQHDSLYRSISLSVSEEKLFGFSRSQVCTASFTLSSGVNLRRSNVSLSEDAIIIYCHIQVIRRIRKKFKRSRLWIECHKLRLLNFHKVSLLRPKDSELQHIVVWWCNLVEKRPYLCPRGCTWTLCALVRRPATHHTIRTCFIASVSLRSAYRVI